MIFIVFLAIKLFCKKIDKDKESFYNRIIITL